MSRIHPKIFWWGWSIIIAILVCCSIYMYWGEKKYIPPIDVLAKGIDVKYWKVDLKGAAEKHGQLYFDAMSKDKLIRTQKLEGWLDILNAGGVLFLQETAHSFQFRLVSNTGSVVGWRLDKETFAPLLFVYNENDIQMDVFFVKGGNDEVSNDFSRLYDQEVGLKFSIR